MNRTLHSRRARRIGNTRCKRAAFLLAAAVAPIAWANTDTWNDGTGNWSVGGNWLSGTVPAAGDTVNLTQSDATTRIVTFDAAATSGTGFAQLTVDATGSGSMTLYQATGVLSIHSTNNSTEYIGYSGSGTFNQTGGSDYAGALYLGYNSNGTNPASAGVYSMSNGAVLDTFQEYVGYSGNGTFNQAGGSNTMGYLYLGYNSNGTNSGGVGVYSMSNGAALSCGEFEIVGYYGNGTFNETGGSNTTYGLYVGDSLTGVGVYSMGNGAVLNASGLEDVGLGSKGTFNQAGGLNSAGYLTIGQDAVGVYSMSNGAVLSVTGTEYIGYFNNGTFNQTGGSNTTPNLYLGYQSNAGVGLYSMSNGAVLSVTGAEYVGDSGNGTFNQTGGSNSAANLYVGYGSNGTNPASLGTYSLSNAATLSVSVGEYIGYHGTGTFNQTGGSNTTAALYIGYTNGASGNYSLSGGVLKSNATVNNGQFTQSGGSASLGALSGTGTVTLGGGSSIAQLSASSLSQAAVTVSSGGYLAVVSNTTQVTNTATSLTITGSGQLDLANQSLLTSTSPSLIRQYLMAGYNGGAWNGTGGISSVNAAANAIRSTALGYTSGTSAVGIALGVGSNQTLVRYAHYGDANLDGTVGPSDLNIVLNNYLSGKPGTWDTGDFTYAGKVDITDLNLTMSNYGATAATTVRIGGAAASGARTLTGVVSPGIAPPPSGQLELIVDTNTGDVQIVGNNADIASLQITSASGGIVTTNWLDLNSQGNGNWSDTARKASGIGEYDNQFVVTGDSLFLNGTIDYGDIYNTTTNAEDLAFEYGLVASNQTNVATDVGSIFYLVPEPTTLSLMGLAAAGLLGRRRRGVGTARKQARIP